MIHRIADFFAKHGEEKFRETESAVLREIAPRPAIVATGGGIVLRPANVEVLRRLGYVAYLKADEATLLQRVSLDSEAERPLLAAPDRAETIARFLQEREPLYRMTADFIVDTTALSIAAVAETILNHVRGA